MPSLSYLYNEPKKENVSTFLFIINVNGKSKQKPDKMELVFFLKLLNKGVCFQYNILT